MGENAFLVGGIGRILYFFRYLSVPLAIQVCACQAKLGHPDVEPVFMVISILISLPLNEDSNGDDFGNPSVLASNNACFFSALPILSN